jgi:hypothetical protein
MTKYKHEYILCPICQKHKFPKIVDYTGCPYCGWWHDYASEDPEFSDIAIGPNNLSYNEFKRRYQETIKKNPDFYYNRDGYPDVEEYKDERGADKTSRKLRCGDCYRKI